MRLTIIIPVHNEESLLESSIQRLRECSLLNEYEQVNIILVENGSSDNSRQKVLSVASRSLWPTQRGWLIGISEPNAGIGFAYARGAYEAIRREMTTSEDWYLWSACDLPFGFSDLQSFRENQRGACAASIIIGSKAHPDSTVKRGFVRSIMTWSFGILRRIILGLTIRDTQGTFFVRGDCIKDLLDRTKARDFFFTTEFCYHATRAKQSVVEIPVVLEPELRPSTVRPIRDSVRMIRGMLRVKYREEDRDL